jgi:hypothetical protein
LAARRGAVENRNLGYGMPLDLRRTLFIGVPGLATADFRRSGFFDPLNIDEFSLIVWNSASLVDQASRYTNIDLKSSNPKVVCKAFEMLFTAKVQDLLQWIAGGHILLLVPYELPTLRHTDITSRNDITTTNVNLHTFPILDQFSLTSLAGELVVAQEPFTDLSIFSSFLRYDYVITGASIIPVFKTSSSQSQREQIVGGVIRIGKGALFISPIAKNWEASELIDYFGVAAELHKPLRQTELFVPAWTEAFRSKDEWRTKSRISEIDDQIATLNSRRDQETVALQAEQKTKILFSGSGAKLVEAVADALRELGLKVIAGPHPRADLLVWDGDKRLAAAEVKGLDGPARESNHRQAVR